MNGFKGSNYLLVLQISCDTYYTYGFNFSDIVTYVKWKNLIQWYKKGD